MPTLEPPVIDLLDQVPVARAVTVADLDDFLDELADYHAYYAPFFLPHQGVWADLYLRGLLTADVPRKNIEAMVLRLLGAGPDADSQVRAAQYFISQGEWDDAAVLLAHQRLVDATLGEDDGVLILDGSDVPKQGTHSVGVARQWCGATGKRDNCQAGVYLAYASRQGYTLLDRRLYLPEVWFSAAYRARWRACRIPDDTVFQTKHELAAALVAAVREAHRLRARWLACDEGFGNSPALLDQIATHDVWYLAEVPCAWLVWPLEEPDGTPRPAPWTWVPPPPSGRGRPSTTARLHPASPPRERVDAWAAQVPAARWQRYRLLEGSKGPLVAAVLTVRVIQARDGLPGPESWLVIRRTLPTEAEEPPVYKYYLSNAPAATPEPDLVRVSGLRWPIESCFAEGKSEVGLDHYEVRTWRGWHHHLTLVILAHFFLTRLVLMLNQREGGLRPGGTRAGAGGAAGAGARPGRASAAGGGAGEPGGGAPAAGGAAAAAGAGRGDGAGAGGVPAAAQDSGLPVPSPPPVGPAAGAWPLTHGGDATDRHARHGLGGSGEDPGFGRYARGRSLELLSL
jgi:SRSO17 transposase